MLAYVFKNVNLSNDSRVSKTDVKSFSSQNVLDCSVQNTSIWCIIISRDAKIKAILRFGSHLKRCPRVSSFHLNNLDNELGNEL